jgi:ribosome-binding protein aMBF1 (putative translation factor)
MTEYRPLRQLFERFSPEERGEIAREADQLRKEMALAELRQALGVSQAELAARLHVRQPAISRLERREDMTVGHLREVVKALGGELQMTARFPDGDVALNLPKPSHKQPKTTD